MSKYSHQPTVRDRCAQWAAPKVSPAHVAVHVVACAGHPLGYVMCQNTAQETAATALLTVSSQAPQSAGGRTLGP
jgi:hypothetical protein